MAKQPIKKKPSATEEIKQKLAEVEKSRDEYLAGWQRAKADFENYKKREIENKQQDREYFNKDWILRILELYDNLERAEEYLPDELKENDWVKAVREIQRQFLESIEGLEEIEAKGESFNPETHEALEQVDSEEEIGRVVEVVEKGYLLNDKVIRPAKVKVSKYNNK
jgi:molecular chaperone GrpE